MTTPTKYYPSSITHAGYSPPTPPTPEMLEIAPGILTPSPVNSPPVPVYGRYAVFRGRLDFRCNCMAFGVTGLDYFALFSLFCSTDCHNWM